MDRGQKSRLDCVVEGSLIDAGDFDFVKIQVFQGRIDDSDDLVMVKSINDRSDIDDGFHAGFHGDQDIIGFKASGDTDLHKNHPLLSRIGDGDDAVHFVLDNHEAVVDRHSRLCQTLVRFTGNRDVRRGFGTDIGLVAGSAAVRTDFL